MSQPVSGFGAEGMGRFSYDLADGYEMAMLQSDILYLSVGAGASFCIQKQ